MVDPGSNHGFASSKPVTMFDATSLSVIRPIDVDGSPDGLAPGRIAHGSMLPGSFVILEVGQ